MWRFIGRVSAAAVAIKMKIERHHYLSPDAHNSEKELGRKGSGSGLGMGMGMGSIRDPSSLQPWRQVKSKFESQPPLGSVIKLHSFIYNLISIGVDSL